MNDLRNDLTVLKTTASIIMTAAFLTDCVQAQPLHWWRFEDGAFLEDSVRGIPFVPVESTSVAQFPLGASGPGQHFPSSFGQVGLNGGAAEYRPTHLRAENAAVVTDDFTIELLVNLRNIEAASNGVILASQFGAVDADLGSWVFLVRNDGRYGTFPRELNLSASDGSQWHTIPSGILIDEDTDYFLATSFDLDGNEATHYAYDLTANSLHISTGPHAMSSLNPFPMLRSGGSTVLSSQGLVDEIRFSSGALGWDELLISDAQFAQPGLPNPAEVRLAPRAMFATIALPDSVTASDQRLAGQGSARSTGTQEWRLVSKFDLPDLPQAATRLESAVLRFHLDSVSGEPVDLSLLHSASDNDFAIDAADHDDLDYTDTGLNLITTSNSATGFREVDVTDFVFADYTAEGGNAVSSFRLQISELVGNGSQLRLAMPRNIANQPLLILNFIPEPSSWALFAMGLLAIGVVRRLQSRKRRQAIAW